jgi:hypothetical protein
VEGPDDFGAEAWFRFCCVGGASGVADLHLLQSFSHAGDVVGFVFWLVAFGGLAQAFEIVLHAFESLHGKLAIASRVGRWTCAVGFFPAAEAAPKKCDDEGVFLIVSGAVLASVKESKRLANATPPTTRPATSAMMLCWRVVGMGRRLMPGL